MSWRLRVDIWEIAYMDNFPNSLPQKKKERKKHTNKCASRNKSVQMKRDSVIRLLWEMLYIVSPSSSFTVYITMLEIIIGNW